MRTYIHVRLCFALLALQSADSLKLGGSGGGSADDASSGAPPLGKSKAADAAASSPRASKAAEVDDEPAPAPARAEATAEASARKPLLVVGSLNLDSIIEVDRLPTSGENVVARKPNAATALGGKGANQAIAAARLARGDDTASGVEFVCQFGNDAHAAQLERVLADSGVRLGACGRSTEQSSGQGLVFLEPDGSVAAVVLGGSNEAAWTEAFARTLTERVAASSALLLQREIPEAVNEILAAAAHAAGVPVIYDVGGAERPLPESLLALLTYVCPNETELARLTSMPTASRDEVLAAARSLRDRGASNVLVTLGAEGALLLTSAGQVLEQPALAVPGGTVVDATGAGDAFRAAFATALTEGRPLGECLRFASAAGAVAVSRLGAEPSLPTRDECDAVLAGKELPPKSHAPRPATAPAAADGSSSSVAATAIPTASTGTASAGQARGDGKPPPPLHGTFDDAAWAASDERGVCPLRFGSRLNSMSARPELWEAEPHTRSAQISVRSVHSAPLTSLRCACAAGGRARRTCSASSRGRAPSAASTSSTSTTRSTCAAWRWRTRGRRSPRPGSRRAPSACGTRRSTSWAR